MTNNKYITKKVNEQKFNDIISFINIPELQELANGTGQLMVNANAMHYLPLSFWKVIEFNFGISETEIRNSKGFYFTHITIKQGDTVAGALVELY